MSIAVQFHRADATFDTRSEFCQDEPSLVVERTLILFHSQGFSNESNDNDSAVFSHPMDD